MSFSGIQITRLGLYGAIRSLYGSFTGKTPGTPLQPTVSVLSSMTTATGLLSIMNVRGMSVESQLSNTGISVSSTMSTSTGLISEMSDEGISAESIL